MFDRSREVIVLCMALAGAQSLLEKAKLQTGRQSHAVNVSNVRLALSQLSAAGLDLTVSRFYPR
jgi:hypothetical protein